MATYVLVHGAWHGGWCWNRVAPLLRAAGHEVVTPTLTGLGERSHLASPKVDLSTHVQDVTNVLFYDDLSDVILVGHSYGGQVISGAADRSPQRIRHLVYLDALVPEDGQSIRDMIGPQMRLVDDWQVPPPAPPFGTFGVSGSDLDWLNANLTPHPRASLIEPIKLSSPLRDHPFARTYILADDGTPTPFQAHAARLRQDDAWQVKSLPIGHDVMVTMPRELAGLLLAMA